MNVTLKRIGRTVAKMGPDGTKVQVLEREPVREDVYIHARGHFQAFPPQIGAYREAFRTPSQDRDAQLDEAYRLWKYDALGGNIVNLTTYFVLGRGVTWQFDDEQAQFFVNKFFKKNNLEMKLRACSDQSTAYGEVFMWLRPKFENVQINGKTIWRMGDTQFTDIDPQNITSIRTSEEDPSDVWSYIYEYLEVEGEDVTLEIPDITKYNPDTDVNSRGCIIHIKLNASNADPFGCGDLIRIQEWLDNYQEYLRDGVIINKLYRSPAFDISIEDGTPDEINDAIARYRNWRIGTNPVHNAKEQWKVLEFTGPNVSNETSRRALLLIIAAGVNFAEYMLADGANANMASSKSQQLPVIKKFEDRQDIWLHHLNKVFQFVLMIKAQFGRNTGLNQTRDVEGDFEEFPVELEFPGIAQDRDVEVAQTNDLGLQGGYMSPRTAATRLGLNYDREVAIVLKDAEMLVQKMNSMQTVVDKFDKLGIKLTIGGPRDEMKPAIDEGKPDTDNRPADNQRRQRDRDRQSSSSSTS